MAKIKHCQRVNGYLQLLLKGGGAVNTEASAESSAKTGSEVFFEEWDDLGGIHQGRMRTEDGRTYYCWKV